MVRFKPLQLKTTVRRLLLISYVHFGEQELRRAKETTGTYTEVEI